DALEGVEADEHLHHHVLRLEGERGRRARGKVGRLPSAEEATYGVDRELLAPVVPALHEEGLPEHVDGPAEAPDAELLDQGGQIGVAGEEAVAPGSLLLLEVEVLGMPRDHRTDGLVHGRKELAPGARAFRLRHPVPARAPLLDRVDWS